MKSFAVKLYLFVGLLAVQVSYIQACHGQLIVSGLKDDEKEIILHEHNRLRQMVATGHYPGQPGAENMREIVWDDELAKRAQQWADNCQFRHDPHRTINRFTMGQNLAIIWSTAPLDPDDGDFPSRIQSWFNEVQKYSFGDAWSPKTGHYSQLVWGETSLVGCGFAEYKDNIKYNKLYVCNYGPGGNVVGYNPYEVGKPSCASYGMKPSARYHGLCAAPNTEANSIAANTIETYEIENPKPAYTNLNINNNNNNNILDNTESSSSSSSSSSSISSNNNYNTNNSKGFNKNILITTTSNKNNNNNNNNINNNNSNKHTLTLNNINTSNNNKSFNKKAVETTSYQSFSSSFSKFNQQAFAVRLPSQPSQVVPVAPVDAVAKAAGSSFGSPARGSSFSYTTEPSQYKYKNKLESYRPTSDEFQRSVLKHTILRTYLDQSAPPPPAEPNSVTQTQPQTSEIQISFEKAPLITSTKAPSRGWSLLTWRG